jgi:hypothetical protein
MGFPHAKYGVGRTSTIGVELVEVTKGAHDGSKMVGLCSGHLVGDEKPPESS